MSDSRVGVREWEIEGVEDKGTLAVTGGEAESKQRTRINMTWKGYKRDKDAS